LMAGGKKALESKIESCSSFFPFSSPLSS